MGSFQKNSKILIKKIFYSLYSQILEFYPIPYVRGTVFFNFGHCSVRALNTLSKKRVLTARRRDFEKRGYLQASRNFSAPKTTVFIGKIDLLGQLDQKNKCKNRKIVKNRQKVSIFVKKYKN
jgi:hypothetical protein